jgi:hypothetical protein
VTVNNNAGPFGSCNWNENNLNPLSSNNWRASLVPAAAVIPAPIAYIKVVAVKKLVVGPWAWAPGWPQGTTRNSCLFGGLAVLQRGNPGYCEEIRVFKAGVCLDTSAWNNKIGLCSTCWFGNDSND